MGNKMPRKNPKEYTQMQIKKSVLKKLKTLKIHPQQSYSEVIENLLKSCSIKRNMKEDLKLKERA